MYLFSMLRIPKRNYLWRVYDIVILKYLYSVCRNVCWIHQIFRFVWGTRFILDVTSTLYNVIFFTCSLCPRINYFVEGFWFHGLFCNNTYRERALRSLYIQSFCTEFYVFLFQSVLKSQGVKRLYLLVSDESNSKVSVSSDILWVPSITCS